MMRFFLFFIFLIPLSSSAQVELGLFGGISTYSGDLTEDDFVAFTNSKAAVGIYTRFTPISFLSFKLNLYKGEVEGDDAQSSSLGQRTRNLSFQSDILELGFSTELNIYSFTLNNGSKMTPYFSGGITGFYFNPKAELDGKLIELQPLGTEGQGLPGNPERYSNFSYALMFGGGLKYKISDYVSIGFDIGARKSFTDYIDDVSTTYPNLEDLGANSGVDAVRLSNRTPEFNGLPSLLEVGQQRGNPNAVDWYFMGGVTVAYLFKQRKTFADYK